MHPPFSWNDGKCVLIILLQLVATLWCCPTGCLCNYRVVMCKGSGLRRVPNGIPHNTVNLDLPNNNLRDIPRLYLKNLTELSIVDLSHNEISGPFSLPENVTRLNLNNNRLTGELLADILVGTKQLRNLKLNYNPLGALLQKTFADLGNLESLEMMMCNLSNIKPQTFAAMQHLKFLYLTGNRLSDIAPGTFGGLTRLLHLSLAVNKISVLQSEALDGLSSTLYELLLYGNDISYIEPRVFRNLSRLQILQLGDNRLKQPPDLGGTFKRKLDLRNNLISDISGLAKVHRWFQALYLSGNQIEILPPRMFYTINIFNILDLSHNKIQEIPDDYFANCTKLLQLILNHNSIKQISSRTFIGMKSLKQILLFHNKISSISKLSFYETPLQDLFLHNNNISYLDPDTFQGLNKTLKSLTIFGNPIYELPYEFFEYMGLNTKIAITCSTLKRLPVRKKANIKAACAPSPSFFLLVEKVEFKNYLEQLLRSGFSCKETKSKFANLYNCTMCPPGHRGNELGLGRNMQCIPCPSGGFYQDEQGQVLCKECKNGTYVSPKKHPGSSASDCMTCPQGTKLNEMSNYRACRCLSNFYRLARFGACIPCPSGGVICCNGTINLTSGYYWKWVNESQNKHYKKFVENINTVGSNYDQRYSKFDGKLPIIHSCPIKDSCLGGIDSICAKGYQGPLCAICRRGYFLLMNTCANCPSMVRAALQGFGVIIVFVLVLLAVLWGDSKKTEQNRSWADVILSRFKIVVGFYQVMIAVFTALARVHWPSAVLKLAGWLRYVEANILELGQLSCIDSRLHFNVLQQFRLVVCSNATVVAFILIYMIIKIRHIRKKDLEPLQRFKKVSAVKRSCYRNIFVFLFTTYPSTCVKIIQILPPACVKLCYSEDPQLCQIFLRSDFSVKCFTPEHNRYWYAAAVMVLYAVGFPLLILALLWKYYYKLLDKEETPATYLRHTASLEDISTHASESDNLGPVEIEVDETPSSESQGSREIASNEENPLVTGLQDTAADLNIHTWKQTNIPDVTFSLRLFYENYKARFWFWEVTDMYRKLVLMCGLVFIGSHSRSQIGIGVLLSGIFAMLHAAYRPIADKSENMLQSISLLAIFFDLSLGVMLKSSGDMASDVNQQNDSVVVSVLFVAVNCLVIAMALVKAIKTAIKVFPEKGWSSSRPLPIILPRYCQPSCSSNKSFI